MNLYGYLCVEINGSNTKNHYIELNSDAISGVKSDRTFWGDVVVNPLNLELDGYLKMQINGNDYYLKVFTADASYSCCTNLIGTYKAV